jgi:hypothetical protein
MHETIEFYITTGFALSAKLALKTPNFFYCFSLILRFFLNDRRSVAVQYDTGWYATLKHPDKYGLPTVSSWVPQH